MVEPAARIEEQEKRRQREREQGRWPLDHKSISCQLNSECFACSSVCSLQACSKERAMGVGAGQEQEQGIACQRERH